MVKKIKLYAEYINIELDCGKINKYDMINYMTKEGMM